MKNFDLIPNYENLKNTFLNIGGWLIRLIQIIENLTYDNVKGIWNIDFVGDQRTFHYKNENVKIIKNCLKDKQSATVFDYLLQMAQFSDIKNDEGQNLLVKNLEKSKFVEES